MVSDARYFLLRGWARYLSLLPELEKESERIVSHRREGRWAILVHDDVDALRYQRLHFRMRRAKYAVGMFGLISRSTYTIAGMVHATPEEIAQDNRDAMAKVRDKAKRAKELMKQ